MPKPDWQVLRARLEPWVLPALQKPRWWLLALAGVFWLVGQFSGVWLLFLPTSMLLALLLLAFVGPRWQLAGVSLSRQMPGLLRVGQEGFIEFHLYCRWPVWQLVLRQPLGCGNLAEVEPASEGVIWGAHRLSYRLIPETCGLFSLDKIQLESGFPFGLWPARRDITLPDASLWVHPPLVSWSALPPPVSLHSQFASGATARRAGMGEFFRLREYQHHDGPGLIDWKSSAKYQQWRVKEFASPTTPRVLLALDSRPEFNLGLGGRSSRAAQAGLAASLARACCAQGWDVCLVTEAGILQLPGGSLGFTSLDDAIAALPSRGQFSACELLEDYGRGGQDDLWVHFCLRSQSQEPRLRAGVSLWNLVFDDASFAQPLLLTKAVSRRREAHIWDFHISANTPWEQLFRDLT